MNNDLQQEVITISAVEMTNWGVKLKSEKNLIFNVSSTKKDGTPTAAFQYLQTLPNMGMGLTKLIKYASVQNSQGGTSRYVRIISDPLQGTEQSTTFTPKTSPQAPQSQKQGIQKETVDWDKRDKSIKWLNALNNACLLLQNKDYKKEDIKVLADYIYTLEPSKEEFMPTINVEEPPMDSYDIPSIDEPPF